jgi:hypothetical protein
MNSTSQQQHSAPSSDRGARVIQKAIELMQAGKSKGWSHALAMARAEIRS